MARRRRYLKLLAVGAIGTVAGCSDGETTTETATQDGGTRTVTPTTTLTPTETATDSTTTDSTETVDSGTETPGTATDTATDTTPEPTVSAEQVTKLAADDGDEDDNLGWALTLGNGGDTAVVGAYNDEDPNGYGEGPFGGSGSAYVFERSNGTWSQSTKLSADDGDTGDWFAESAALSDDGTTVVLGAPRDEDPDGTDAGSAYVFTDSGGSWSQQAKLTPDDGDDSDQFGQGVAVASDGTTALVGATADEDPNGTDAGSAYVFTESDDSWSQQTKLSADDGDDSDRFGAPLAMADDGTALVGASGDEDPNGDSAGSVYVFEESDGTWSQQAKLAADDGDSGDAFGISAAISDDGATALIGAITDEDPNGPAAGSAYMFEKSDGTWSQQTKFADDDGDTNDVFGQGTTLNADGTTAVVGATGDEDPNGSSAGSAYVFTESDGTWSQQAKLTADDSDDGDLFGAPAALVDGTVLLGAYKDEDPNGTGAGAAYVFDI